MDYSKYKRFFAFGCSFTGYMYPTWSDIMSKNIPNARYYNFGRSGGGNMFIASRLSEANRKYKFCETDLVMVMWSTFCREDRWLKDRGWITPGNIYTQGEYDFTTNAYLCTWGDPITYLVRDLALIDITNTFIKSLPCDSLSMLSVPFDYQQEYNNNQVLTELMELYSDLEQSFPPNMFDHQMNGVWGNSCEYTVSWSDNPHKDYHPSPKQYYEYLSKLNIPMSDEALSYANNATEILKQVREESDFWTAFPKIDPRVQRTDLI